MLTRTVHGNSLKIPFKSTKMTIKPGLITGREVQEQKFLHSSLGLPKCFKKVPQTISPTPIGEELLSENMKNEVKMADMVT